MTPFTMGYLSKSAAEVEEIRRMDAENTGGASLAGMPPPTYGQLTNKGLAPARMPSPTARKIAQMRAHFRKSWRGNERTTPISRADTVPPKEPNRLIPALKGALFGGVDKKKVFSSNTAGGMRKSLLGNTAVETGSK